MRRELLSELWSLGLRKVNGRWVCVIVRVISVDKCSAYAFETWNKKKKKDKRKKDKHLYIYINRRKKDRN